MSKLSFVLPATLREKRLPWRHVQDELSELRLRILISTLLRNLREGDLEVFWIICPDCERGAIETVLRSTTTDPRIIMISEEELCHEFGDSAHQDCPGWYKQQIIKLAIAHHSATEFYLTLDLDILCTRPFGSNELLPNGRALLNIERPADYHQLYVREFAEAETIGKRSRRDRSASLLGLRHDPRIEPVFYGETPVLLHAPTVRALTAELSSRFAEEPDGSSRGWVDGLLSRQGWTEYTLYFSFVESRDLLTKLYEPRNRRALLDLDSSIWQATRNYRGARDYAEWPRADTHGFFVSLQSWLSQEDWIPPGFASAREFLERLAQRLGATI